MKTYKSIIQSDMSKCYVCKTTLGLHKHHIFEGTANRAKSEECHAIVRLCGLHHNLSNHGVHFDKKLDLKLKQEAQKELEKEYSREWFIQTFGKSYL